MNKVKAAIIGSGNIGTDLMMKLLKGSRSIELAALVGIDPASEGLAMARERGVATTHEGIEGLRKLECYKNVRIAFDATSAYAHKAHNDALRADGVRIVDLTPAAIGHFTVPPVNACHVSAKACETAATPLTVGSGHASATNRSAIRCSAGRGSSTAA